MTFNLPHLTGKEAHYMYQAVYNGKLSGNGGFITLFGEGRHSVVFQGKVCIYES